MTYLGDFAEDATVVFFFNTVDTGGAPITIGGTAAVEVYKDGGTTQSSAGVTVTEDFDSITGLHKVEIDMSSDAFYAASADYTAVVSVGTADSVSIVGGAVASWSCENRTTTQSTLFANVVQISDDSAAAIALESYCDGTTPIPANTTQVGGVAVSDAYVAVIKVNRNASGGDTYAAQWFKNGVSVTSTITNPTFAVYNITDNTNLFISANGTVLGSGVTYYTRTSTGLIQPDEVYRVTTTATIDSGARTSYTVMSGADILSNVTRVTGTTVTNVDDFKADVSALATSAALATVDANVDAILTDTGTTLPATLATIDGNVDAILVDTGTTIPAQITGLNDPTAAAIADAVWDEAVSDHQSVGSFGNLDNTIAGQVAGINLIVNNLNDLSSSDVATAILDAANGIETGVTPRQAFRAMLSAMAAKVSGMDTNAPVFRDVNDTKNRITATTDANGNRSAITLDLT